MSNDAKKNFPQFNFLNFMTWYGFTCCIIFFFWLSLSATKGRVPQDVGDIKIAIITLIGTISGFIWGSSRSSKEKDATLQGIAAKPLYEQPQSTNIEKVNTINVVDKTTDIFSSFDNWVKEFERICTDNMFSLPIEDEKMLPELFGQKKNPQEAFDILSSK